ncbi:MAG: hypothetical protein QOF01_816 [Thermomicrobiales bacterium]|nr:hypothetical protein [Thermomicrobiales bacterium]
MTTSDVVRQSVFLAPDVLANPYPLYAALRAEQGDGPNSGRTTRRLFSYADIAAVLRDDRFSVAQILPTLNRACLVGYTGQIRAEAAAALSIRQDMLLYTDPPQHTRLRKLVRPFFSASAIEALRPRIEQIVNTQIDAIRPSDQFDLIVDLAGPLPALVIAEIIGFPAADRDRLVAWSSAFSGFFGIGQADPTKLEAAVSSYFDFSDYVASSVKARQDDPRSDLLTALLAAESRGELSPRELIATCMTLLIAGSETTTGLIGNGMLALLLHPGQLDLLRQDPTLIDHAVEELARYDSPVQLAAFVPTEPIAIGKHTFRQGALVECWIGAANRDPAQFDEPDRLYLRRTPNRHLAFGTGTHFCLGSALGRLEAKIAFNGLVREFPQLHLTGAPISWRPSVVFRSPASLPLAIKEK